MKEGTEFVVVSTTVDSEVVAQELAGHIVREKLAACVQHTHIQSTYRWKGTVESASEYLVLAKTRASLADKLIDFIKRAHTYDVPEIIVTPITGGFEGYLDWIVSETGGQQPSRRSGAMAYREGGRLEVRGRKKRGTRRVSSR